MTTLLSTPSRRTASGRASDTASSAAASEDPRYPLALVGVLGGAVAAAVVLAGCVLIALLGWLLADGGVHGAPRDGVKAGALAWLMAHGSGALAAGVPVTAIPLGITALAGWFTWRVGHRVGDAVSGHGPDADRISDGERDWTVLAATTCFLIGYAAVAGLAFRLAGSSVASPGRLCLLVLGIAGLIGGVAIALGSGRLAMWTGRLPGSFVVSLALLAAVLRWFAGAALALFVLALLVDVAAAANIVSQLQADAGDSIFYSALTLLVLPNIVLFAGAYLLGPGFAVGAGTVVSPQAVALGPLPLFPALAALPDDGPVAAWTPWLVVVPVVVAAAAAYRIGRRFPTRRWEEAASRGLVGGVGAAVVVGIVMTLAGGAVGPGRMQVIGPDVVACLLHAVVALGLGALLGSILASWRARRAGSAG